MACVLGDLDPEELRQVLIMQRILSPFGVATTGFSLTTKMLDSASSSALMRCEMAPRVTCSALAARSKLPC
jgi:hypothetical protein